ncbi:hypothetical protein OEZ85_004282 [Tetradesmus obliquus]|uniref:Uncharacterized protein n=1 Tax=Tetradesmus obliquus TaxID=3088 RepID=A0ABY8UKV9_TETOB|nr:hypothetical protein OEZ85_004282 [Tetradesmus obliquus]
MCLGVEFYTDEDEQADVWLRLLACCSRSTQCGSEASKKLVAVYKAQQTEAAEQCQALTASLQLQHNASQKAAQLSDEADAALEDLQQLLREPQSLLHAAVARGKGLQQQLAASRS